MSEHKTNGAVTRNGTLVVPGISGLRRSTFHLKLVLIALAALALIAVVGLGVRTVWHESGPDATQRGHAASALTPAKQIQRYLSVQNYGAAEGVYQTELQTASSNTARAQIYLAMGTVALDAHNDTSAYADGVRADKLAPSAATARFAAYAAQQNGNKAAAAAYYQLAINRLDMSSPTATYNKNDLEAALKEVRQ